MKEGIPLSTSTFRDTCEDNIDQWVFCFRVGSGINTTMAIEAFHNTQKAYIPKGGKLER